MKAFWAKVNKDGPIPSHMPHLGQCWIYGAGNNYGVVKWKTKSTTAHRVSWELTNGPIPKGKMVLHHCDNPPCVNPDHLFIGTAKDNMRDALSKGRRAKRNKKGVGIKQTNGVKITSRLRIVMAEKGLTIETAAAAANLSPNTILRVCNGESVTMKILSRICDGLNVRLSELVEIVPTPQTKS